MTTFSIRERLVEYLKEEARWRGREYPGDTRKNRRSVSVGCQREPRHSTRLSPSSLGGFRARTGSTGLGGLPKPNVAGSRPVVRFQENPSSERFLEGGLSARSLEMGRGGNESGNTRGRADLCPAAW